MASIINFVFFVTSYPPRANLTAMPTRIHQTSMTVCFSVATVMVRRTPAHGNSSNLEPKFQHIKSELYFKNRCNRTVSSLFNHSHSNYWFLGVCFVKILIQIPLNFDKHELFDRSIQLNNGLFVHKISPDLQALKFSSF